MALYSQQLEVISIVAEKTGFNVRAMFDKSYFALPVNDLFQPKKSTFLHALSFEWTSKMCINFLNQFLVYFHT